MLVHTRARRPQKGYTGGTYFTGSLQVTNACGSKSIVHSNNFALEIYSLEFNIVTYAYTHTWVGMPKRGLTINEVDKDNAQMLAFKVKELAIARSHKQLRKLAYPRGVSSVGVVTVRRAVGLIRPPVSVFNPAIRVIKPAVSLIRPAMKLVRPAVSLVGPAVSLVGPAVSLGVGLIRPGGQ